MCRLFGPHNMEDGVFTKMGSRAIRSLVRTGKYLKMHQDMFLVVTPQSRKSTYSRLIRPLNPKLTELIC